MIKREDLNNSDFKVFYTSKKQTLPTRAQNILNKFENQIDFQDMLLLFLKDNCHFEKLPRVGKKTQYDLALFFKNLNLYIISLNNEASTDIQKNGVNNWDGLAQEKKLIFENFILYKKNDLSRRSLNILNRLSKGNEEILFIRSLFNKDLNFFYSLENSGKKTAEELFHFISILRSEFDFILKDYYTEDDIYISKLVALTNGSLILKKPLESKNPLLKYFEIYEATTRKQNLSEVAILYYQKNFTKNEIAETMDLSYERIRQIHVKLKNPLTNLLIKILNKFELEKGIFNDFPEDYIRLNEEEFEFELKKSCFSPFKKNFIDEILFNYLKKLEINGLTPHIELIAPIGSYIYGYDRFQSMRSVKSYWLYKNSLIKPKVLTKILRLILIESCKKNSSDRQLLWTDFKTINDSQIAFLSALLIKEFQIFSDTKYIYIERNTPTTLDELIYIALEELDKMSLIEDIVIKLEELFPNYKNGFYTDSVRNTITRYKEIFIYERRQISLYGLKVWEYEKGLKGGTIKDLAFEYLKEKGYPCHINEISKFIISLRENTNSRSIVWNLTQNNTKFKFYRGSLIGLKPEFYKSNNSLKEIDLEEIVDNIFDY